MKKKTVTVLNVQGIHCRPSTEIIMKSQEFSNTTLTVEAKGEIAELNSMLSLLGLGLAQGDIVTMVAEGEDEHEACEVIASLFEYHFDFPKNE